MKCHIPNPYNTVIMKLFQTVNLRFGTCVAVVANEGAQPETAAVSLRTTNVKIF
jgi:hypothetical protein